MIAQFHDEVEIDPSGREGLELAVLPVHAKSIEVILVSLARPLISPGSFDNARHLGSKRTERFKISAPRGLTALAQVVNLLKNVSQPPLRYREVIGFKLQEWSRTAATGTVKVAVDR